MDRLRGTLDRVPRPEIGPWALLAVAGSLLLFTRSLAAWSALHGAVGLVGWSGFYVSALILVVFGIEYLARSPHAEVGLDGAVRKREEPVVQPQPERLAS